ncbi:MAG TPA: protein kinase [Chthonomonadaceae bacterium]|nr:protein kinase [Chthonomonadaceae bacterium]
MHHPGDAIGPYTLIRSLGSGAFGEVWLAERATSLLTTRVALKLPRETFDDLDAIRHEAQVWLQASGHTNVVPVLEAEVYDGQVVIASEYVAGGTLAQWMAGPREQRPTLAEVLPIIRGVLDGLHHLHRNSLIHRDLKPENILMKGGTPCLTDFGLTRVLKPDARSTNMAGTPAYMAPESFKGQFSAASDVWAAGILLHEMVTGSLPYPQADLYSLLLAITGEEPAAISDAVPEPVRPILARALAKVPADRFESAEQMAAALAGVSAPSSVATTSAAEPRTNLPAQLTSFIGRDDELAAIDGLLAETRLLTLTGSGGTGKTRLAQIAARAALPSYDDGVWLVELAALSDGSLAPQSIADVLGIGQNPGESISTTLSRTIRSRRLLLVLDNCEHLLESVASLVDALLRSCAQLHVLATSREPLGIAGEHCFRVPSLPVPDPRQQQTREALERCPAVQLFLERARAVAPDFRFTDQNAAAIAAVCWRLDGIPLAIELAAARARMLTAEQIGARMDDRFRLLTGGSRAALPRHQTLRAMIDWSYDLLTESERTVLQRLSIFSGGWVLEAAEAACADGSIESWQVLDLLASLTDKSLVVLGNESGQPRYRVLETVRQYARDRFVEAGDFTAPRDRHRDWMLAFAEEAEAGLRGHQQREWLDRLETEHDNLRAALGWSIEAGAAEPALRFLSALQRFWYARGYFDEGRALLDSVLSLSACADAAVDRRAAVGHALEGATPGERSPDWEIHDSALASLRAMALSRISVLALNQGDVEGAVDLVETALSLARTLGDRKVTAHALHWLGCLRRTAGVIEEASVLLQESVSLWRAIGDRWEIGWPLLWLGYISADDGDLAGAESMFRECLTLWLDQGDRWGSCFAYQGLGYVALLQNELAVAQALYLESLTRARAIRHKPIMLRSLQSLVNIAARRDDHDTKRELEEEILALRRDLGKV